VLGQVIGFLASLFIAAVVGALFPDALLHVIPQS